MELSIGIDYVGDMLLSEFIPVFPRLILFARIDKEDISIFLLSFIKYENCSWYSCSEKEIRRESDHCFEDIFFDGLLSDLSLTCTSKEYSMRHNHSDFPFSFIRRLDHMTNKCPVSFTFWWHSSPESIVFISRCFICTPLIEREWRIGNHGIEFHEYISFLQFWIIESVSPADSGIIKTVKEHIHHSKRPRASVCFLPVERKVI